MHIWRDFLFKSSELRCQVTPRYKLFKPGRGQTCNVLISIRHFILCMAGRIIHLLAICYWQLKYLLLSWCFWETNPKHLVLTVLKRQTRILFRAFNSTVWEGREGLASYKSWISLCFKLKEQNRNKKLNFWIGFIPWLVMPSTGLTEKTIALLPSKSFTG